jgi:chromosome partitioning protein
MTKIIGLVQVKGGAGRSTVSTNLAGELSKLDKTVLIDCDMPQGTSASWFAVRQQKGRQGKLNAVEEDCTDIITNLLEKEVK